MTTATAVPAQKAGVSVIERQGAHAQLAHRLMFSAPEDCKFMSLAEMRRDADEQRKRSIEIQGSSAEMLFATRDGQDYLALGHDDFALTNFAYKQLARNIGLPIETVARLKPETRVRVFNELWQVNRNEGKHEMQFLAEKIDGKLLLRAVTDTRYTRLWDSEVLETIDNTLVKAGWVPAHPTFNYDLSIPVEQRPKALIRTDRYSFAFLFTQPSPANNAGFGGQAQPVDNDGLGGLRKGMMVWNSETSHKSFGWSQFVFRNVCGNFLIWGMKDGKTKRARHVGVVREAFEVFAQDCRELAAELTEQEMDQLTKAKHIEYAKDDEAAIKRLNYAGVSLGAAKAGVEAAKLEVNGGDLSIWSVVNGLTFHAKELANEEDRTELCAAAGHVLNSALAAA
ncbi:hypothetical protein PLCT2_02969 [Planctomycetaceae bacterium]|nr:hypothetical protein PLCT2_02969 [Planctomycetaceae bacterium]